jgi:hypothetical protein
LTFMKCAKCLGCGWVCEDHLDRPSDLVADEGGCNCGGAAVACTCNPDADYEFADVYACVEHAGCQAGLKSCTEGPELGSALEVLRSLARKGGRHEDTARLDIVGDP